MKLTATVSIHPSVGRERGKKIAQNFYEMTGITPELFEFNLQGIEIKMMHGEEIVYIQWFRNDVVIEMMVPRLLENISSILKN